MKNVCPDGKACYTCGSSEHVKAQCPEAPQGGDNRDYNRGGGGGGRDNRDYNRGGGGGGRDYGRGGGGGGGGSACYICNEEGHQAYMCPNMTCYK